MGREKELDAIHELFGSGTPCVVIHGLAGQGKTQTALAYYHAYKNDYFGTFWIDCEDMAHLEASYVKMATKLQEAQVRGFKPLSGGISASEPGGAVECAKAWLASTGGLLMRTFCPTTDSSRVRN